MNRGGVGLLFALAAVSSTAAPGDSSAPESGAGETVTITWDGVRGPTGRLLLIRKEHAMCAVRFTTAQRYHDQKPVTTFNSGEESTSAEYDWWFQDDGSGDFMRANVTAGHEKLHRGPLKGIGRLAFQTGSTYVKCGPFKLTWFYPSAVDFWGSGLKGDYGIELAPTPWRALSEIDLGDPRLRWIRYDAQREFSETPLDEYWNGRRK